MNRVYVLCFLFLFLNLHPKQRGHSDGACILKYNSYKDTYWNRLTETDMRGWFKNFAKFYYVLICDAYITWPKQKGRPRNMDFKAMFPAIEENLLSCTRGISGEIRISLACHVHNFAKSISSYSIVLHVSKILQIIWLTNKYSALVTDPKTNQQNKLFLNSIVHFNAECQKNVLLFFYKMFVWPFH